MTRPFSEHLRYGIPLGNGIILQKPFGAPGFLVGYRFRGYDTLGASWNELKHLNAQYARALGLLNIDWTVHTIMDHRPGGTYPTHGYWPHRVVFVLDMLRKLAFEAEGQHHRSDQTLWLTYYPSSFRTSVLDMLFGRSRKGVQNALGFFEERIAQFEATIAPNLIEFERLDIKPAFLPNGDSILADVPAENLHRLIHGTDRRIASVADVPVALDNLLAAPVQLKPELRIGNTYKKALSAWGFPENLFPAYLDGLRYVASPFQIVNRIIPLSRAEAIGKLRNRSRQHLISALSPMMIFAKKGEEGRETALALRAQVQGEIKKAELGKKYCISQTTIIAYGPDADAVNDTAVTLQQLLEPRGFTVKLEDTSNQFKTVVGALPGETHENLVRSAPVPLAAAVRVAPFAASWHGPAKHPDSRFPAKSDPLMKLTTAMGEEFNLFTHVGQNGNALLVGPPGKGKSLFLNSMRVAHLSRYQNSRIVSFDVGRSNYKLARLIGAYHATPKLGAGPQIAVLRNIEDPEVHELVLNWLKVVGAIWLKRPLHPEEDTQLEAALSAVRKIPEGVRCVSDITLALPQGNMRQRLERLKGSIFDAKTDGLRFDDPRIRAWFFELGELGVDNVEWSVPFVEYIELRSFWELARLDDVPTQFDADEFARLLQLPNVPEYAERIEREGRKHRWTFLFGTQGTGEIMASPIRGVLVQQTPTKIAFSNPDAAIPDFAKEYVSCGFHPDDAITIASLDEHDMLIRNQYGVQIVRLNPSDAEITLLGGASNDDCATVDRVIEQYGQEQAAAQYLRLFGRKELNDVADTLDQLQRALPRESAA